MTDMLPKDFHAILVTRDKETTETAAKALQQWPLVTALKFVRQFRLSYPRTSTSAYELERVIEQELRRKELAPCIP